ncbi:alpha/beta hydrolase [Antarctobacter jejuensis]|uniref:alpha/beta hydrolase n=1 Tax=Antarctobacter jejuensis TaxID=1439938 RepID=UPI003FD5621C
MSRDTRPSLRARLINTSLRLIEKRRLARVEAPKDLRRGFERSARLFFHGPRGARYDRFPMGDTPAVMVTVPDGTSGIVLLYFHGGGYVMGSPRTHQAMLARLCAMTGSSAILPDYRKAPEHPFPAAFEDAMAAYAKLLGDETPPAQIVIGGDSAGGGLALALLAEICRRGLPQPARCFAFSPLTDLTFSGASFQANAEAEVMLPVSRARGMQEMYLGTADPRDPRVSPLFADFTGACPVWLVAGDTEILLDDTRRMAERLRAQGVTVSERIAHDLPHVWPIFHNVLPEARRTLRDLARWINSLSQTAADN